MIPGEKRVCYGSNSYCIACYDKTSPRLDAKPFGLRPGDTIASIRTGEKVVCGNAQSRAAGHSVDEGRTVYCETCYRGVRKLLATVGSTWRSRPASAPDGMASLRRRR